MPVEKFRSLDDARRALWSDPASDEAVRRLDAVLELWSRARPKLAPRGVQKFRSIDEAAESRRGWGG